ncbi:RNA polymerase sigma factor [Georgenia sp. MJ173]|uniref:RNA polymerase sigma factor n=1 Tax=Georgenia sunbinii TaxID=3117728 RepID=UPI002F267E41
MVRRFARAALLDEAAVDDVAQDALISVAASIGSFRGSSKITTWVHRIVRHRVVDHLRRQRATSPLPPDDLGPAERMSSMIATRATVRAALASLPELYRDPVTMRDLGGLTYDEIAQRLDRSIGTVKSQVSRGRALVAATLRGSGSGLGLDSTLERADD